MNAMIIEVVASNDGTEIARRILPPGAYLVGRAADCALRFDDPALSGQHARLEVGDGGTVNVEDLSSENGTFLNEERISAAATWTPGTPMRVGDTVLTFDVGTDLPTVPESLYTPPSPAPISTMESAGAAGDDDQLRRQLRLTDRPAQRLEPGHEVARGGMGVVRTARESATRRTVAVKVMLRPESTQDSVRFITEARITAQLEHPNIVPIYDLGVDAQGKPYYSMKLVEGITLLRVLQLLKEGVKETVARYPLATLLTIFQKLCDAVAFAHARGSFTAT